MAHAQAHTGCRIDAGHALHGGDVALESVYCLGLCAQSPSATINGEPHARLTPERFDQLLHEALAETATHATHMTHAKEPA